MFPWFETSGVDDLQDPGRCIGRVPQRVTNSPWLEARVAWVRDHDPVVQREADVAFQDDRALILRGLGVVGRTKARPVNRI